MTHRCASLLNMDHTRLRRLARRQLGLFTVGRTMECGFSRRQVERRVAVGTWRHVSRRVRAESGLVVTPRVGDLAAQLAVPGSVLAGFSAARVFNIPVPDSEPHLIVSRRLRQPPGMKITRVLLDPRDVDLFETGPVTSRPRTIVDCLHLLPDRAALDLLDRALQKRWIDLAELTERVRALVGRHGAPRLVGLVAKVSTGSRSAAERRLLTLMRMPESWVGGPTSRSMTSAG